MTKKWMLAVMGGTSGIALAAVLAHGADAGPMIVTDLTGDLRIEQGIPCADDVDQTTPVTDGRLEITPSEGVDVPGGKAFVLTRASVSFAPFSIHRSCLGISRTRSYTQVGVQIGRAVPFTATASGGAYLFTIPKENFEIFEATVVNGGLETGYKQPSEPVTGTIDLALGTVQMRVVVATKVHFKAGCVDPCPIGSCEVCLIDETKSGKLTANLSGTIVFPDADGDGVPDRSDNCKFTANPDQSPVATPVVTPPQSVTLASCADHQIGSAFAADVCDATPVIITNNAPVTFAVGNNVVTWQAEDGHHRTGTATQNVTVVDTTAPIITSMPPDLHLLDCGSPNLGLPTATDDCAGTVAFTNNAPPKFFVGTTVVTWTATDASGNHATSNQTVTVVDTVAPTVSCVATNPTGTSFVVTAIDSCTSSPVIRLGSFVIANGETIKINETGQHGVQLVNDVSSDHIRHFQVGKGEAVITATDASSNVGTAICR
jgi:Thrombospondin type 3 repeat/HYR domain